MSLNRVSWLRRGFAAVVLALCAITPANYAWAERISADQCNSFFEEFEQLEKTDLPNDISKGPQWAKENLPPERIRLIGRFIFLQEQIEFRCPDVLAAAAVRRMEEQARLKALARVERERLWLEAMKKVVPPERKPESRVAQAKSAGNIDFPPLPERKSR